MRRDSWILTVITQLMRYSVLTMKKDTAIQRGHLGGYTRVGIVNREDAEFNAGYSCYSAAWPLLREYPGHKFQSGLFGTWMFAHLDPPPEKRLYSDIEGGLGWWRDTEYPTETPKFIMGGVALDFSEWANGPGAGKGRDWGDPKGNYAVAQLSPYVLWPPDGLNLKQGTCGELLGYGYIPLPLTDRKSTTAGVEVPTGDHSWTLFLNAANFKGPVTFFTPYFWSKITAEKPELGGMFLDSKPSQHRRHFSMETQHLPWAQAADSAGNIFGRLAPTLFPSCDGADSSPLHLVTSYSKAAMWERVKAWFEGGPVPATTLDPAAAHVHSFEPKGGPGFRIWLDGDPNEQPPEVIVDNFMKPAVIDQHTFCFEWDRDSVARETGKPLIVMPEYYRMIQDGDGRARWTAVPMESVPEETGLASVSFSRPEEPPPQTYITPEEPDSCWKKPGPVAGPFKAHPGDGSTVTYYWYRFADQPAMLNADMTDAERETVQQRVEKIHAHWGKDSEYLPPPEAGTLAEIDPALLVTPPKGLEIGHVPIVTRQGLE